MAHEARALHLVDASTGEIVKHGCPNCSELEDQLAGAENNVRSMRAQMAKLKRDDEQRAREHELWPKAVAVFRYWQGLTGHDKARFTPDRFWLLEPFIRREDSAACRAAIRGCVGSDFHMKRGAYANRKGALHDKLEQIFANQGRFEAFRDMDLEHAPSLVHLSLVETAKEVAERVLERAKLIEAGDDPPALAHLLVEVDRLIYRWRQAPEAGE